MYRKFDVTGIFFLHSAFFRELNTALVMNWLEVMLTFSIGLAAHAPRGVGLSDELAGSDAHFFYWISSSCTQGCWP
jgi:hypothetical protein